MWRLSCCPVNRHLTQHCKVGRHVVVANSELGSRAQASAVCKGREHPISPGFQLRSSNATHSCCTPAWVSVLWHRYCRKCDLHHAAHTGDVWFEGRSFGFLPLNLNKKVSAQHSVLCADAMCLCEAARHACAQCNILMRVDYHDLCDLLPGLSDAARHLCHTHLGARVLTPCLC
jgi:hypothetical protein